MNYYAIIDENGKVTNVVESFAQVCATPNFICVDSCDMTLVGKYYENGQFVTAGKHYVELVKTADGEGSGLDADLLRGKESGGSSFDMIVAWDGQSVPDVSKIPQGIAITYQGTSYTGTLVASSSTKGKFYIVYNSNGASSNLFDEYVTVGTDTFSWELVGNATIDLSNYYTKTETDTLLNNNFVKNTDIGTKVPALNTDGKITDSVLPDTVLKTSAVDGKTIIISSDKLKTSIGGAIIKNSTAQVVKSDTVSWGGYGTKESFNDYRGRPGETVTLVLGYNWDGVSGTQTVTRVIRSDRLFDSIQISPISLCTFQWYFNGNTFTYSASGNYMSGTCTMSIQIKSIYQCFDYMNGEVLPLDCSTVQLNSSGNVEVKDGGIGTGKIASNAVVEAKIAQNAITEAKITNGAVSFEKINSNAVAQTIGASETASTNKLATEKAVALAVESGGVDPFVSVFVNMVSETEFTGTITQEAFDSVKAGGKIIKIDIKSGGNVIARTVVTPFVDVVNNVILAIGAVDYNDETHVYDIANVMIKSTLEIEISLDTIGGSTTWGEITGDITDQEDLSEALSNLGTQIGNKTKVTPLNAQVTGASEIKALNINDTNYNLPSGGSGGSSVTLSETKHEGKVSTAQSITLDGTGWNLPGWGKILGNITDQSDLINMFRTKQSKITAGTTDPTGGDDGDVYIKYTTDATPTKNIFIKVNGSWI